jgi:hypothetical protein
VIITYIEIVTRDVLLLLVLLVVVPRFALHSHRLSIFVSRPLVYAGKSLVLEWILLVPSTIVKCFDLNILDGRDGDLCMLCSCLCLIQQLEYPPLTTASDQCVSSLHGGSMAFISFHPADPSRSKNQLTDTSQRISGETLCF